LSEYLKDKKNATSSKIIALTKGTVTCPSIPEYTCICDNKVRQRSFNQVPWSCTINSHSNECSECKFLLTVFFACYADRALAILCKQC